MINTRIIPAAVAICLSFSCGLEDEAERHDPSQEPSTVVEAAEPQPVGAVKVLDMRLVDSVRWYEPALGGGILDSGIHHRIELVTSTGLDTIPAVFAIDKPSIRADSTAVVGLMHQDGRRSGFFTYVPGDVIPEFHTQFGRDYRFIIDPQLSPNGRYVGYIASDKYREWAEVRSWPDLELLMATPRVAYTVTGELEFGEVTWFTDDSIAATLHPGHRVINACGSVVARRFVVDSI